jgi:hypothetical protein
MRVASALLISCFVAAPWPADAQARRGAPARPAPAPATKTETPEIQCPAQLGDGVATKLSFCDVLIGRDPAAGVIIKIPPHRGNVTLTFDLHNRHTYSAELSKDPRTAFAHYTAVIGALTADNTLISRAVVESEFRSEEDLLDRIAGGAGPGGVKAVAPIGTESIRLTIPEAEDEVSLLGEKLLVERPEGTVTYTSQGRPIAVVSNVQITYRPAPARRAPARRAPGD